MQSQLNLIKRLKIDEQIRLSLYSRISIYSSNMNIEKIKNIYTLELFSEIDDAFNSKDKAKILFSVEKFFKNEGGIFNQNYGMAKHQLEKLIEHNNLSKFNQIKLTTEDVFTHFNVTSNEIKNLGIQPTTKTQTITKIYEYLAAETLKTKYSFVKNVIICGDGKVKLNGLNIYNGTKLQNYDLLIEVEDSIGNKFYLAFDHKVKDYESCIKDIQKNGMKFHVLTLGDVEDHTFYQNFAVKQQLLNFEFEKISFSNTNSSLNLQAAKIVLDKEISKNISSISINSAPELVDKAINSVREYESTGNFSKLETTPLIPVILCNSKDIAKTIVRKSLQPGLKNKSLDYLITE